ncbi:hypothetical protein [Pseudobacter ginsenosidimutans]|uniref:Uncharacterized protein n=1 Tax=Pseudobacter ginsenosidimutans TaxID=661488 RepID=A0A4Q7MUY3_9BACT|nr:hypothetical protein [Pseudobacter ginsenosidimutans]QEC42253.1 hypothetical protein FSB84_11320 [Pseudobacter ginsenosidimutans]RZS70903.1 hypothetical protein EV199_2802 [Pseudobacter ginsenosidimutans]
MTTIKGFIRSTNATLNRVERNQKRKAREAADRFRKQLKEQELSDATAAVQEYEEYIEVLKSVHKDVSDEMDWQALAGLPEPPAPGLSNKNEETAINKRNNYRPSLTDKLFGLKAGKIRKLDNAIPKAQQTDNQEFQAAQKQYESDLQDWKTLNRISNGILKKQLEAYKEAVEQFNPFGEINELGSKLTAEFQAERGVLDLHVNTDQIIPRFVLSQTSTGKLSKKEMGITRFNELYQDYISSCMLRVARETFALLPLKSVIVNAKAELLNNATGKMEEQIILSVAFVPETFSRINFELIDPSDSLKNFVHNMKFSKTGGFSEVPQVEALSHS